jgi:hypothetical protein
MLDTATGTSSTIPLQSSSTPLQVSVEAATALQPVGEIPPTPKQVPAKELHAALFGALTH